MQKNNARLRPLFLVFFITTFIGEGPIHFYDIFHGYFKITLLKKICANNHMFERAIWDKLHEWIFENFEIARVKRG